MIPKPPVSLADLARDRPYILCRLKSYASYDRAKQCLKGALGGSSSSGGASNGYGGSGGGSGGKGNQAARRNTIATFTRGGVVGNQFNTASSRHYSDRNRGQSVGSYTSNKRKRRDEGDDDYDYRGSPIRLGREAYSENRDSGRDRRIGHEGYNTPSRSSGGSRNDEFVRLTRSEKRRREGETSTTSSSPAAKAARYTSSSTTSPGNSSSTYQQQLADMRQNLIKEQLVKKRLIESKNHARSSSSSSGGGGGGGGE